MRLPKTEEGDNWTVVVFKCSRENWSKTLKDFFSFLEHYKRALLTCTTLLLVRVGTSDSARTPQQYIIAYGCASISPSDSVVRG